MKLGLPGKYTCGHNIILAHAKTLAMYKAKYAATQHGRFSIALDGKWGYAKDPSNPAGGRSKRGCRALQNGVQR
jgi:VCBS repeat-containing protein